MKKRTKLLVFAALFAAIITVCTRVTMIPIFGGHGYVHIGDAFIFLAASLMPTPYAVLAAAIGGAFADILSGFTAYALPTALIKAGMVLSFKNRGEKLFSAKRLISCVISSAVLVGGYYIAEVIMFQSFISPVTGIFWNLMQALFSVVAFAFFAIALDAAGFSKRLGKHF